MTALRGVLQSLSFRPGSLSGSSNLEALVSPEYLTAVGSFCVEEPSIFPYHLRVDVQWERDGIHHLQPGGQPFVPGAFHRPLPVSLYSDYDYPQLSEVASGVTYLHDLRIVHGDLKGVRHYILQPLHH